MMLGCDAGQRISLLGRYGMTEICMAAFLWSLLDSRIDSSVGVPFPEQLFKRTSLNLYFISR